jgi:hypothetical protein
VSKYKAKFFENEIVSMPYERPEADAETLELLLQACKLVNGVELDAKAAQSLETLLAAAIWMQSFKS